MKRGVEVLVRCMSTSQLGHVDRSGHVNEERHRDGKSNKNSVTFLAKQN